MKGSKPISPWGDPPLEMLTSPDGAWTVSYSEVNEIAMGAPVSGTLTISNGMEIRRCNGSFVWSEGSRYLAVPQWTKGRMQHLVVVDLPQRRACRAVGVFRVLELHSFTDGVISGIDSPVHRPVPVSVSVVDLDWSREIQIDPFDTASHGPEAGVERRIDLLTVAVVLLLLAVLTAIFL